MNKEELIQSFNQAVINMSECGLEIERLNQVKILFAAYLRMYNSIPHCFSTDYDSIYTKSEETSPYEGLDSTKTIINIAKKYDLVTIRVLDGHVVLGDHLLMTHDEESLYGCYDKEFLPKEFEECIVKIAPEDSKTMAYVTQTGNGFSTRYMEVAKQDCDLETNYNDDLPIDTIKDFLNNNTSGIIVLNGNPGTGNFCIAV